MIEALKLLDRVANNREKKVIALWGTEEPIDIEQFNVTILCPGVKAKKLAIFSILAVIWRFALAHNNDHTYIFTHYSTFLIFPFIRRKAKRYVFVQDLEWKFIKEKFIRGCVKKFMLMVINKSDRVVSTSQRLLCQLELREVPILIFPICAERPVAKNIKLFEERDFDILLVVRSGIHKEPHLYEEFLKKNQTMKICIVSIESKYSYFSENNGNVFFHNISRKKLLQLMGNSKILVNFSAHEGFGLIPLEALACGCALVCRKNFGAEIYLPSDYNYLPGNNIVEGALTNCAKILSTSYPVDQSIEIYNRYYYQYIKLLKDFDNEDW